MSAGHYVRNPEHREASRQRNLGRKVSAETRQRLRLSHLGGPGSPGRKMSPELKEKLRLANLGGKNRLGKNHTVETKRKISLNRQGKTARENNPNWGGGVSRRARSLYMTTGEYQRWRKDVFERDNYTCQRCGKQRVYLQADHIKPYEKFPELRIELSNGRSLCKECHKNRHSKEGDLPMKDTFTKKGL